MFDLKACLPVPSIAAILFSVAWSLIDFHHIGDAFQAIHARPDCTICRDRAARIFRECHATLPDGTPREGA